MPTRQAFTAIELLVILSIFTLLVGIATPSIQDSMLRTRVRSAANLIQEAHREASRLARLGSTSHTAGAHYGVQITSDVVRITYGSGPLQAGGQPVWEREIPPGIVMVSGNAPITNLQWICQYGTGYPAALGSTYTPITALNRAVNLGFASGDANLLPGSADLAARSLDPSDRGRHRAAIRILKPGVVHVDLE